MHDPDFRRWQWPQLVDHCEGRLHLTPTGNTWEGGTSPCVLLAAAQGLAALSQCDHSVKNAAGFPWGSTVTGVLCVLVYQTASCTPLGFFCS